MKRNNGQIIIRRHCSLGGLNHLDSRLGLLHPKRIGLVGQEQRTTRAFELAEAGVERGYQQLILSTTTLGQVEAGGIWPNYNFDRFYTDLPGGQYSIRLVGNPARPNHHHYRRRQDNSGNEVRAVQAVYAAPGAAPDGDLCD